MTASSPHRPFDLPTHARSRVGAYAELAPPAGLAHVVECSWVHAMRAEPASSSAPWHRVLPDDAVSLAHVCRRDERGRVTASRVAIVGPVVTPRWYPILRGEEMTAVKIRAEWVTTLLGVTPTACRDDIPDVVPTVTEARLADTRHWRESLAVLWHSVLERIARVEHRLVAPTPAQRAILALRQAPPRAPVRWTAASLRLTTRHLRRLVVDEVGVSPKALARSWRFLRVLTRADRLEEPGWAGLAADAGFADQAHLANEFRLLTGASPARVHAERRAESRAYSLAR